MEKFERKVFHLSEITLVLIIATLTLLGVCSIFYLGRKEVLYKETPTYVITIDDPVCKCEIAYESRYYLFKKNFIKFHSEIDYEIDTSLVLSVKLKRSKYEQIRKKRDS